MTELLNLPQKLNELFTLKTEKNNKWLEYLSSEANYVNGKVYVHKTPPVYHLQEFNEFLLTNNNEEENNAKVLIKGTDNFTTAQITNTIILIDNIPKNYNISSVNSNNEIGIKFQLPYTEEGALQVIVPPLNTSTDQYQGLTVERNIIMQDLIVSSTRTYVQNDVSYFEIKVNVVNAQSNQQLKLSSLYRSGGVQNHKTIKLTGNGLVTIYVKITNSSDKWKLELLPYEKTDNTYYLGKMLKGNINV